MDFEYVGDELELFRHAHNWKKYYGELIKPFFGADVLEVGAGIGATTEFLCSGDVRRWVCLEPDEKMASVIAEKIARGELPEGESRHAADREDEGAGRCRVQQPALPAEGSQAG